MANAVERSNKTAVAQLLQGRTLREQILSPIKVQLTNMTTMLADLLEQVESTLAWPHGSVQLSVWTCIMLKLMNGGRNMKQ